MRETSVGCSLHARSQDGPQPRAVPGPGIEPAAFPLAGWYPARCRTGQGYSFLKNYNERGGGCILTPSARNSQRLQGPCFTQFHM